MTGYMLFRHAVLRVFRNFDDALAVSGLIWVGITALLLVIETYFMPQQADVEILPAPQLLLILIANLAVIGASIWIAVAWHKFALLDERPTTLIPPFELRAIASYLGRSLLIGVLIILFASLAAGILTSILGTVIPMSSFPFFAMIVVGIPAIYSFYRVSPLLPAAALGEDMRIAEAWALTADHKKAIFQAAFFGIMATLILQVPAFVLGTGIIALLYGLAAGWITLMVGVSLLSSIYHLAKHGNL